MTVLHKASAGELEQEAPFSSAASRGPHTDDVAIVGADDNLRVLRRPHQPHFQPGDAGRQLLEAGKERDSGWATGARQEKKLGVPERHAGWRKGPFHAGEQDTCTPHGACTFPLSHQPKDSRGNGANVHVAVEAKDVDVAVAAADNNVAPGLVGEQVGVNGRDGCLVRLSGDEPHVLVALPGGRRRRRVRVERQGAKGIGAPLELMGLLGQPHKAERPICCAIEDESEGVACNEKRRSERDLRGGRRHADEGRNRTGKPGNRTQCGRGGAKGWPHPPGSA